MIHIKIFYYEKFKISSVGAGKGAANQGHGSHVMVFDNPQFGTIRTMTDENGEPLFCGKDVCEALGYRNVSSAVNQHVNISDIAKHDIRCEGTRKDSAVIQSRTLLFVNESGFYALVIGSKLDTAQKFKQWVTSEVLPQIRKTGGYIPLLNQWVHRVGYVVKMEGDKTAVGADADSDSSIFRKLKFLNLTRDLHPLDKRSSRAYDAKEPLPTI